MFALYGNVCPYGNMCFIILYVNVCFIRECVFYTGICALYGNVRFILEYVLCTGMCALYDNELYTGICDTEQLE